jgi:beta-galactosidase
MSPAIGSAVNSEIEAKDHQFRIGGETTALYGGAVHYWRLDRDKWSDILDKVKGTGLTTVSIYIPWEIHETAKGEFDFGSIDPRKDIDAFLTLCELKGFNIVVRPGPQINAELTWFGYPRRLLEDPELQALNAEGTKAVLVQVPRPIPALSYAVDKFFEETASWYDAICPILAKHRHPKGRLVAIQVDNEMAYFFHINPYASDYHPASIRRYREFLKRKHGTLEAVAGAHNRKYASFDEIDAPRRFDAKARKDLPGYTDWIEYREVYLIDSLGRLADMMKARGLAGVPMFHNYPHPLGPGGSVSGITTPFNLMGLEEKLDFVGFDLYSRKELYEHVKTVLSYVVGSSRYPYIPELIAGVWPWYLHPGDLNDEEFVTKAALMQGIKGFSRYVLVERDRWLASPIMRDGTVRPDRYAMHRRAVEMAKRHDFVHAERQADVLLLANRDYDRLEAASALVSFPGDFLEPLLGFSEYPNFMMTSEETFGFEESIQQAKAAWFNGFNRGLTDAGVSYLLSDSAAAPEKLAKFKAVVVSSFEFMGAALQRKLVDYAKAGGLVVLGPRLPKLNELMREDETLLEATKNAPPRLLSAGGAVVGSSHPVGRGGDIVLIHRLSSLDNALAVALASRPLLRVSKNDTRLDVVVRRASDESGRAIVFVANPSADPIEADVGVDMPFKTITEIWTNRSVRPQGLRWVDKLPAYSINIYECTK